MSFLVTALPTLSDSARLPIRVEAELTLVESSTRVFADNRGVFRVEEILLNLNAELVCHNGDLVLHVALLLLLLLLALPTKFEVHGVSGALVEWLRDLGEGKLILR